MHVKLNRRTGEIIFSIFIIVIAYIRIYDRWSSPLMVASKMNLLVYMASDSLYITGILLKFLQHGAFLYYKWTIMAVPQNSTTPTLLKYEYVHKTSNSHYFSVIVIGLDLGIFSFYFCSTFLLNTIILDLRYANTRHENSHCWQKRTNSIYEYVTLNTK